MRPIEIPRLDLSRVLLADRGRLIGLDRKRRESSNPSNHAEFQAVLEGAQARFDERLSRHQRIATPVFDDALPIAARRDEIKALVAAHQVVIVCGETGSGKTTQLPKICLELGLGQHGMIGCTQPRRIAARTLATRLAKELGASRHDGTLAASAPSNAVGYKIRFNDKTDDDTFVKVMTDGILLAETHSDRMLRRYDTIIIDEAHERSLNIDFLLGYVKQLLPRRPELKVIITSATIDPKRFADHFDGAPVIEVSGRTYPVEVRYRPEHFMDASIDAKAEPSSARKVEAIEIEDAVVRAVEELFLESSEGDVLVFLPGEREIRDTAEALRKQPPDKRKGGAHLHADVLPLYSRLSNAEQDRIFQSSARRRIILATNVAETSLTVPGIRYVVDTGVARIHRYSARQKIDMLQIEPISQASAKQRAGRCGRVAAGVCIRLYEEADHDARPVFTTPEILRTSLASVILRMQSLGLGDVAAFPFVEPPSPRMIEDGYRQLFELGAVDGEKKLTALGHKLAKFPIDPALSRMLMAGEKEAALREVLILASFLSVQDPRDRPADKQQEAAAAHEQFAHPQSEFMQLINIWDFYLDALKHKQSSRKLDQLLREKFLSPLRMREWRDVHTQLSELCGSMGLHVNDRAEVSEASKVPAAQTARYEQIHRAILTGLITNVGTKAIEGDHYLGTRGLKFSLPKRQREHAQQKAQRMKWVMAAELTETTRVYARTIASIEPEWLEQLASHLVTRTHFDPHWERKSGQVVAFEQVSLYGLIVNPRKRVHYGAINPKEAREIFIRHGLVAGEVDTFGKFLKHNLRMIEEIEDLEAKARRQDVLIDDDDLAALYDAVIPADVVNMAGFEKWRKTHEKNQPDALTFSREQLMRRSAGEITFDLYPKALTHRGASYPLHYRFEPGHAMDGVTITLPVSVLNQVNAARFEWLTMGLLREKAAAYFKSLPQRFRSQLVPVPETVSEFVGFIQRRDGMRDLGAADVPLLEGLSNFLLRERGLDVPADVWDIAPSSGRIAPHLFMNFKIVDADGKELAMGRDFAALKSQFADASRTVFSTLHRNTMEREGLTSWPDDLVELPATINFERDRIRYDGFPALVDRGGSVEVKIFDEQLTADHAHRQGVCRLSMLVLGEQARFVERGLKVSPVAAFQFASFFPEAKNHAQEALRQEILHAAFLSCVVDASTTSIRQKPEFSAACTRAKAELAQRAAAIQRAIDESLCLVADIRKQLDDRYLKGWEHLAPDVNAQLVALFSSRFLRENRWDALQHYPRYLKAIVLRLTKVKAGAPERDLEHFQQVRPLWQQWQKASAGETVLPLELVEYRWAIEELRVGLFAQELRTPMPVSVKRVGKMWEALVAARLV